MNGTEKPDESQPTTAACATYKVHLRSTRSQEHLDLLAEALIPRLQAISGLHETVYWDLIDCDQVWYTTDPDEAQNHAHA